MIAVLDPYIKTIKLVAVGVGLVLALGLGSYVGCSVGKSHSADQIKTLTNNNNQLTAQTLALASNIEEANRQVKANQQFAREQQALADATSKEVADKNKEIEKLKDAIAKKINAAEKKNPGCVSTMEAKICPELLNY